MNKKYEHRFIVIFTSDDDRATAHEALTALVDVGIADATESLKDHSNESPLAVVIANSDIAVEE